MPFASPAHDAVAKAYEAIEEISGLPQSCGVEDARTRLNLALVRTSRNMSVLLQRAAAGQIEPSFLPEVARAAAVEAAHLLTALRGLTGNNILGPLTANPTADRLPAMVELHGPAYSSTAIEEYGAHETNMLVDQFGLPMMHHATVIPGAAVSDDELILRALGAIGAGAEMAAAAAAPPKFTSDYA